MAGPSGLRRCSLDPSAFLIHGTTRRYPSKMDEFIGPEDPVLAAFGPSRDFGGVHLNCTIVGHAAYLMAQGLGDALGLADSERIFYRCLTHHMVPQSQFIDARLGCIASAEELFGQGSPQALKTAEAFDAVEIFAAPPSSAPPASQWPPVNAPDSTIFIRGDPSAGYSLWRREAKLGDGSSGKLLVSGLSLARPVAAGDSGWSG